MAAASLKLILLFRTDYRSFPDSNCPGGKKISNVLQATKKLLENFKFRYQVKS